MLFREVRVLQSTRVPSELASLEQKIRELAPFEELVSGMALATGSSCAVKHRRLAPCRSPEFEQVFLKRSLAASQIKSRPQRACPVR